VLNDFLMTGYVVVLLNCHRLFIIDHGVFFAVRRSGYLACDISGMNVDTVNIGDF
jgi:hypothetical protein